MGIEQYTDRRNAIRVGSAGRDAQRYADPLSYWRFAVPRLRDAFGLFTADNPINELHMRGPNKGGKTFALAAFVTQCAKKARTLDGASLPQWKGPIEATQLVLDYPQQLLSVQPAYLRALGGWPYHPRYDGEILKSLRIKPIGASDNEATWSVIHFLSQENRKSGKGVRSDIVAFDEPPLVEILRELRKAAHAGRRGIRIIGETPTKRREWAPLLEDYGDSPRRAIRRVDRLRAEVRWSLDEVADWVLSPQEKRDLWDSYRSDPLFGEDGGARWHGDYMNTEGSCPFDAETIVQMIEAWCRPPELVAWRIPREKAHDEAPATIERVNVEVWGPPQTGKRYYICVDPASGKETGHPLCIHVVEYGTGELVARWNDRMAPHSVGVLAAGLARQYNNAEIDIEMKDHWGVNVVRGCQSARYGNLRHETRELRPGTYSKEVGFDQNEETKKIIIGCVTDWIEAFRAGDRYAPCPSREVFNCLLDCVLDERDMIVAGPGAAHAEDLILRGQSLRRAVTRSNRAVPEVHIPPPTREQKLFQEITRGAWSPERQVPGGREMLKPKSRPR